MKTNKEAAAVAAWLAGLPGMILDIKPVKVTLHGRVYFGASYTSILPYKEGMDAVRRGEHSIHDTYEDKGIYLVGLRPSKLKGRTEFCFPWREDEWYIAGHIDHIHEEFAHYHPFGPNFILKPWSHKDSKIDTGMERVYLRLSMDVEFLDEGSDDAATV